MQRKESPDGRILESAAPVGLGREARHFPGSAGGEAPFRLVPSRLELRENSHADLELDHHSSFLRSSIFSVPHQKKQQQQQFRPHFFSIP